MRSAAGDHPKDLYTIHRQRTKQSHSGMRAQFDFTDFWRHVYDMEFGCLRIVFGKAQFELLPSILTWTFSASSLITANASAG
jgi:hypothetical protein